MSKEEAKEQLRQLRGKAILRKVTCTRKVASHNRAAGDVLLSYEVDIAEGATLDEARTLALLVGLEVDMAAHNNALAGGVISEERLQTVMRAIRSNYNALLAQTITRGAGKGSEE